MQIQMSEPARVYLGKKIDFFLARARVPRIVLAEHSCRGANFRLFFEPAQSDDEMVESSGLQIYVPKDLADEFWGFSLDMEQFFLNRRLTITPLKQSYKCDCSAKCVNSADAKAEN